MLRQTALTIAAAFICAAVFAQKDKDIPSFGKIEKTDLTLKECAFDNKAEAMVLFDAAEAFCSMNINPMQSSLNSEIERHVRIKILTDKGLGSADVKIPFLSYKNGMQVRNLTANTYNLDDQGNIVTTKLDKKAVFTKKVNSRYSQVIFTLPDVKAGSVIEYKYSITGSGIFGLDDWHFQKNIPVAFSRYSLNFPYEIEVNCQTHTSLPIQRDRNRKGQRDIQTFTMTNIPALRDEPYITCEDDYVQKLVSDIVAFNGTTERKSFVLSWPQVIRNLMDHENFGVQLKRNIPRTKDLDDQLGTITDDLTKMKIIHAYVRKNMEWDGNNEIWAENGVRAAWASKKGTSGEINMILVNLLKSANLKAHPILVSTRSNGRVNTGYTSISQFDKVLAHLKINGKTYVLDGTDQFTPSTIIPYDVMYSEGLVIENLDTHEWGWTTLWDEKQIKREAVVMNAVISPEGELKGTAIISSYDYARAEKIRKLKDGKDAFLKSLFQAEGLGADSIALENTQHDSLPLVQRIPFKQKLNASGDYHYFSTNLFSGFERNPFVAENRVSDIFFSTNQQYNIVGLYSIPEDFEFEDLPQNIRMIMPDSTCSLSRRSVKDGNKLSVRITVDFKSPVVASSDYIYFQEFYKKMHELLNEQYVIKRKNSL